MKPLLTFVFAAFLPVAALAQGGALAADAPQEAAAVSGGAPIDVGTAEAAPDEVPEQAPDVFGGLQVLEAVEVELDSFLWQKRLILLFANTSNDPAIQQQLEQILERAEEFVERDVVVIVDTDPAANSDARRRLRPRGFMMAIIDKDGEIKQRRPAPRSGRELMAVIDRFPLRRQEMLEQRPSGRN